jgi:uncharacterized membrane protein
MKDFVVPFMHHVYRPILIGLTGLAIYWMWQERREGYLVAMVLTIIASGFGVLVTIFNLFGKQWSGAFTCLIAFAFPALMALWFSYRGFIRSNQS